MLFDATPARLSRQLAARLTVGCALIVSAELASCGGRAADGPEPEAGLPSTFDREEDDSFDREDDPSFERPVRETCADNPLLAGCSIGDDEVNEVNPPEPLALPAPEEPLPIAYAQDVLASHCSICHGPELTEAQASDSINYITDWDRLIRADLIQECSPERSRLVVVMRTGDMPPPASGLQRVPERDIEVVERAIELNCRSR